MKKIIKNSIFLLLIVFSFYSCVEESKFVNPIHFGLDNGAFAKFTEAPRTTVLLDDFRENGFFSDQLIDANDNMINYTLTMTALVSGTSSTVENFIVANTFPTSFDITAESIASALGIPVLELNFGDSFQFVAVATRNDDVLFNGNPPTYNEGETSVIGDETLGGGNTDITLNDPSTGYYSAMNFGFIIACDAFNPSDATGTYLIVQSTFFGVLGETREVIGGPFDDGDLVLADNQIAIIGAEWNLDGADPLIFKITPNGIVTDFDEEGEGLSIPVSAGVLPEDAFHLIEKGIVLPCVNKIDLNYNIYPYTGNEHKFVLERI